MDTDTLRRLQQAETEILEEIDRFCGEKGIKYSLYGGTALGAVRHGGFIPWDDDLDIVMTRNEFNRFFECWEKEPLVGYFLQNALTDITCGMSHTKIRKDGTLFLGEGEAAGTGHQGIWIDILVWDKVPERKLQALYVYWNVLRGFIYTRGYSYSPGDPIIKRMAKRVLQILPEGACWRQMQRINRNIARYKDKADGYKWMSLSCIGVLRQRQQFPAEMTDEYTEILFEGRPMKIVADYERMLELQYGDYRKLPPEEERVCAHHPAMIRFEPEKESEENENK